MLRKLLVAAVFVGLVASVAPQPASANAANSGVLVFTGVAKVGNSAWSTTAVGDGLCFPGFVVTPGACTANATAPTDTDAQSWSLSVPLSGGVVAGGVNTSPQIDFPQTCNAAGVFNGAVVTPNAPTGPISNPSVNNCEFSIDGFVDNNAANIGPSCGMSKGTSAGGPSSDSVTVNGVTATAVIGWETSAGGSLPINGTIQYPGHTGTHLVVGYTQARPVSGGNCATVPAKDFVSAGVLATLPN